MSEVNTSTTNRRAFFFNPKSIRFRNNPYEIYKVLRASYPYYYFGSTLFLSRYHDVYQCLREPRLVASGVIHQLIGEYDKKNITLTDEYKEMLRDLILFQEGDDFSKHRKSLMTPLSGVWVDKFREIINTETEQLLADVSSAAEKGPVDIVASLIRPLWVNLFSSWLGFVDEDKLCLVKEVKNMRLLLDPSAISLDGLTNLKGALINLSTLFRKNYQDNKIRTDKGIFFQALHYSNPEYTERDYILDAIACFIGGTETIGSVIANTLLLLTEWPEEQRKLRYSPDLLRKALMESMRMETPAQMARRSACEDFTIGDIVIKKGDNVVLCLGAANRDSIVFAEPDKFSITRDNSSKHLAFGSGRYQCVGRALGQFITEAVCYKMLRRFGKIERDTAEDVKWQSESIIMRMPEILLLSLTQQRSMSANTGYL